MSSVARRRLRSGATAGSTRTQTRGIEVAVENLRTFLIIALCAVSFMLWQAWVRDYNSPQQTQSDPLQRDVISPEQPTNNDGIQVPASPEMPATQASNDLLATTANNTKLVSVTTDLFEAQLDGNAIRRLALLEYPVSIESPDVPFALLDNSSTNLFLAESGLLGSNGEPNQDTVLSPSALNYSLRDGSDTLPVKFTWEGPSGIKITKTYLFTRGSYEVKVSYRIDNATDEPWSGRMFGQFRRNRVEQEGGLFRVYTYTGGILSGPEKPYEKIDFDDMAEVNIERDVTGGWLAMIQHYFAGAWIPGSTNSNHYYSRAINNGNEFLLGLYYDQPIAPGESKEMSLSTYLGPKIQSKMEKAAPGLRRTVDYGWLFFLAQPMFAVLSWIHALVKNWGWTIIIFTILLKGCFYWLSATSYRSMARMRKLQPRMLQLRERYGDDKQRLNQSMMEMYKKEKINPLGGCLPILVQIPFFIALYWVLLESVELRQAPFIGWYKDLAQHDPYFVLPILMGVSMIAQQKLNPTPPDPLQAKIMMALPFIFTFFFLFFPAGLVLYWFVNNILSIAQQWVITKRIENEK